ncbi:hypothetical protein DA834_005069 [Salmonella enterica subsp. enterica serovar 4,[5],12:i:-]|nr:hypothetical protein [Salmonella enterica subsp. enterica serovar 4,[5],12:i:-]EDX8783184.1 hypothetical protein [Salmonella enterica subsp. enterica serovar 4,[5],12:i:-]
MFHTIVSIKNDGHYFCRAGGNRPDGLNEPVTSSPPIKPFFMSCGVIPLILLQSADRQHAPIVPSQSVAHSVLTKHTTLNTLISITGGFLFGLCMASFHWWRRKVNRLPPWDDV